jgi:hypothetical protein
MKIREWLKARIDQWNRKRARDKLLREQGFIVWCKCGEILNNNAPTVSPDECIYTWECRTCGALSSFDMDAPVPLKVETLSGPCPQNLVD